MQYKETVCSLTCMVWINVAVDFLGWTVRRSGGGGCVPSVYSESGGYQGVGVVQKQSNQLMMHRLCVYLYGYYDEID